jgi:hypothetical protein
MPVTIKVPLCNTREKILKNMDTTKSCAMVVEALKTKNLVAPSFLMNLSYNSWTSCKRYAE